VIEPELQKLIDGVTGKRPRQTLDHILKHGQVTTAELADLYGYKHAPRAARDVREHGIPLETFRVTGPDGRTMAAYRLGKLSGSAEGKARGRRAFPKAFKDRLVAHYGERCAICGWRFPARALQIDHRVPYEVAGEASSLDDLGAYMLVCGSCNRSKSWTCEACENWKSGKDPDLCMTCMWGSPDNYEHVALEQRRTLTIAWQGDDVGLYDRLREMAGEAGSEAPDYARDLLKRSLG
jgi:HNH endonuclease